MADPRTDEAALAIAVEKGCGLIVDCAIVLCCDPRANSIEDPEDCSCWMQARRVLALE